MNTPKKILLGHLASAGDCLYATAIARQIKHDFPGCRLTWAIGSIYRPVIEENPYVDEIWEIPLGRRAEMDEAWRKFAPEARRRKKAGLYDEVFFTQIGPDNYQNFDGTVRSSVFRGYPRPITEGVDPVVRLRPDEVERVAAFAGRHRLGERSPVVLFECSAESSQSFVTPDFAVAASRCILGRLPGAAILLSSREAIPSDDPRIIDASALTFRENAELTKYCTLLIGCSSGITWISTSDWAKKLPMIQVLRRATSVFASVYHDAQYFGRPTAAIIEMTDSPPERVAECAVAALTGDFAGARSRFHEETPVELDLYIEKFMRSVLRNGQLLKILASLRLVYRRYGFAPFLRYARSKLAHD